jgi:predicted hydrocarbon binding protein
MLSSFIKKLLFARQFYMNEGNIEVMKIKHVMLPSVIVHEFNSPLLYKQVKEHTRKEFHDLANNFGSGRTELLKSAEDIFDKYGLGRLEIKKSTGRSAEVCIYNSSIAHAHIHKNLNTNAPVCNLTSAVLAGMFSFLYDGDVDCYEKRCFGRGDEFCEFEIRGDGK